MFHIYTRSTIPSLPSLQDMVLMRALRDMNLPKFVYEDVPLFMGLITDLFPGLDCPRVRYPNFNDAVEEILVKNKNVLLPHQVGSNYMKMQIWISNMLACSAQHWGLDKMAEILWHHFQIIYFLDKNYCGSILIWVKCFPEGLIDIKSTVVLRTDWWQSGAKPLSEPMLTKMSDAIWHH